MFIGHYGVAVWDSQRGQQKPLIKLWEAFLAVQAIDIICGLLGVFGIEGVIQNESGHLFFHIPWSHSLMSAIVISLGCGALYHYWRPETDRRGFWVISGLAFSHWIMDLIVHRADLPIYPGGTYYMGLSFWDCTWLAFILESALLAGGLYYWQHVTRAKSYIYDIWLWVLYSSMVIMHFFVIVLPDIYLKNGTLDPSNWPSSRLMGGAMIIIFILLAWVIYKIEEGRPSKYNQNL